MQSQLLQKTAIYCITKNAIVQAIKLQQSLAGVSLFVSLKAANALLDDPQCEVTLPENCQVFDLPVKSQLTENFYQYHQHICIFSAGIINRSIAPLVADSRSDKKTDPAVICLDEQARFVIPLLSGHRGGANAMALRVSEILQATPVLTTASDSSETLSIDMLGAPFGWQLDPAFESAITPVSAAVVNQQPVVVVQAAGETEWWKFKKKMPLHIGCYNQLSKLQQSELAGLVVISDQQHIEDLCYPEKTVVWRPKSLVLGIGCDKNTPISTLEAGIEKFLAENNLAKSSISSLASIQLKAKEPGILQLAQQNQWRFDCFEPAELADIEGIENPSEYVKKITGVASVAEAAALKKADHNQLLVGKTKFLQDGFNMTLACVRIPFTTPLLKHGFKNWLKPDGSWPASKKHTSNTTANTNADTVGTKCAAKHSARHVDLNRPMLYHRHHLLLCDGKRCQQEGSEQLAHQLRSLLKQMGLNKGKQRIKISRSQCAGSCRNKIAMVIYERLTTDETPVNNGLWLKSIDLFTEDQWRELFQALADHQPVKTLIAEQHHIDIQSPELM